MANKTILVTGATSGIGKALVESLIHNQFQVLIVGSSQAKTMNFMDELMEKYPTAQCHGFFADLSRQSEVNRLANEVITYLNNHSNGGLDVLINNAGAVRNRYIETEDGIEYQWALNHLSGFLLSIKLVKQLRGGIILFTGSYSHRHATIHWRNLMFKHCYFIYSVYRQSKLANVMTAKAFNELFAPLGIQSYVVDPGLVNTGIANKHTSRLIQWVWNIKRKKAVDPSVPVETYLSIIQNRPNNQLYFKESKPHPYNKKVDNPVYYQRLCHLSEAMCHLDVSSIINELQ